MELVGLFARQLPTKRAEALLACLQISFAINSILHFLLAHARLGSGHAHLGTHEVAFVGVGADWGGMEGIGAELRTLRKQVGRLNDPSSPRVVADFLLLRRESMLLEWAVTVRHYVHETFLAKNNLAAALVVRNNAALALRQLMAEHAPAALWTCAATSARLPISLALPSRRKLALLLSPWRQHVATAGPYAGHAGLVDQGALVELCLLHLSDMERHVANGEVLGVSLLLEDIALQEGRTPVAGTEPDPSEQGGMLRSFLCWSTELEQLRCAWARYVLGTDMMASPETYRRAVKEYENTVVAEVVRKIKTKGLAWALAAIPASNHESSHAPSVVAPAPTSSLTVAMELAPPTAQQLLRRQRQRGMAGMLVGSGSALELHGVPEFAYRRCLVVELRRQMTIAMLRRQKAAVEQFRMQLTLNHDTEASKPVRKYFCHRRQYFLIGFFAAAYSFIACIAASPIGFDSRQPHYSRTSIEHHFYHFYCSARLIFSNQ
jgi:hypothetical protein